MGPPSRRILQLQRKAERERIVGYRPRFHLDTGELERLSRWAGTEARDADVDRALAQRGVDHSMGPLRRIRDLAALLSPVALGRLEEVAAAGHRLTVKRFGHTMHMFAPLYLSNECVSECTYCGFQVFNRDIVRRTLRVEEVTTEARYLKSLGFRHILLVAGEHPKHVSASYVADCVRACAAEVPNVSVETQVWDEDTYRELVEAGCDGVVVYQEVYDERRYPSYHLKGNKRFYGWRLGAPERAAAAGIRRVGLGSLLGLNPDWRFEVLALAEHARFMIRHHWRTELTVALPRLEPATGLTDPPRVLTDADHNERGIEQRITSECRLANRPDAPGRRQQPRDRLDPARKQRQRYE
jgi:2-iminoacetate synthase